MTVADSDQVGRSVPCVCCSTPVLVPEATSASIEAGSEFTTSSDAGHQPKMEMDEELSDELTEEQITQMVREIAQESGSLDALASARWKRLLAAIIDAFAAFGALLVGLFLAMALGALGGDGEVTPSLVVVVLLFPAMLGICQCYMIAVDGQTVGKMCVRIKIVNLQGKPPGFFQGIVLRIVAIAVLGMIPFFSLADVCWIFANDAKRCLHDYIAGTYVIDA